MQTYEADSGGACLQDIMKRLPNRAHLPDGRSQRTEVGAQEMPHGQKW